MSRERRTGLAIAVAVFLSGAALLGLEITASRVLAPTFGSSLFVWGSLIGIVLTGSRDRLLGGRDRRRPAAEPVPPRLGAHPRCRARRARARDRPDGADVDRRLGSGAAARPAACRRDPLRARRASSSPPPRRPPSGWRRARSSASAAPPAASSRSPPRAASSARSSPRSGSFPSSAPTRCWRSGRSRSSRRRLIVALAVRLVPAAVVLTGALAGRRRPGALARAGGQPAAEGRCGAELVAALPPARGPDAGAARSRVDRDARRDLQGSRGTRHAVPPARRRRRRRLALLRFDNSFQSGMWLSDPYRTRFLYTDYLDLGLAHRPSAKNVLFIGLGGGSAPKRMWRDFPTCGCRSPSWTRRSSTPPTAGSSCRAAPGSPSTPTTGGSG